MKPKNEPLIDEDKISAIMLEDENERQNLLSFNERMKSTREVKKIKKSEIAILTFLPFSYLLFYFLFIPIAISTIFLHNEPNINTSMKYTYSNLFKENQIITIIVFSLCGSVGILLIIANFLRLESNLDNKFLKLLHLVSLVIGIVCFIYDLLTSIIGTIKNFNSFNVAFINTTGYDMYEFLLLSKSICLIIYSIILFYQISYRSKLEKYLLRFTKYLLIISAYIILFLIVYVYIKSDHLENMFSQNKSDLIKIKAKMVLFLPYILHVLFGFTVYTFTFLLEHSKLTLEQICFENPLVKNEKYEL